MCFVGGVKDLYYVFFGELGQVFYECFVFVYVFQGDGGKCFGCKVWEVWQCYFVVYVYYVVDLEYVGVYKVYDVVGVSFFYFFVVLGEQGVCL